MGWWKKLKKGVKKAAKGAGKIATAPVRIQAKALRKAGLGKAVDVTKALAPTAMRYAAGGVSTVPGLGTVGGAALSGAAALAQGRSVQQIARDAAIGAVPGGAIAQELARSGAGLGTRLVRGQRLDRALMSTGREAVTRQAKRYLGGALGAVTQEIGVPMTDFRKAMLKGSSLVQADPLKHLKRPVSNLTPFGSVTERAVIRALQIRPSLVLLPADRIASEIGVPLAAVRQVLDRRKGPTIKWRPVSSRASQFVRQHAPFGRFLSRGDAGALSVDGKTYTIEEGDNPSKVAQKLTGSASRYTELFAANPTWPTVRTTYGKNFKYFPTGRVMKLPESWWPTQTTEPAPATPSPVTVSTPPVISIDEVTAAEMLKSKAILVAWGKTAGTGSAGLTDYGAQPTDALPTWGARDKLMLASFARWRGQGSTDGEIRQLDVDLLAQWAESAATAAIPPVLAPAPAPSTEPAPTVSIPEIVPASIPSMTLPGGVVTPQIPLPTMPTQVQLPAPLPSPAPAPTAVPAPAQAPASESKSSGGGAALAIAALAAAALLL